MTDKTERGIAAQALLDNPLVREILNDMDAAYTAAWRAAKTLEAREDCHRYTKLLELFVGDLQSIANTGEIERARLKELERGKRGFTWPTI